MDPRSLGRLAGLLGAIAAAESRRLAVLASELATCRDTAAALRVRAGAAAPASDADGGDLAATARWRSRLMSRARAAEQRAVSLAALVATQHRQSTQASGRARMSAALAEALAARQRRDAERRAEEALPPVAAGQSRDSGPDSPSPGTGAGSPGMT